MLQLLYMICSVKVFSILDKQIPLENYVSSKHGFGMSPRTGWSFASIVIARTKGGSMWEPWLRTPSGVKSPISCKKRGLLPLFLFLAFGSWSVDQILEKTGSFVLRIFFDRIHAEKCLILKEIVAEGIRWFKTCNSMQHVFFATEDEG